LDAAEPLSEGRYRLLAVLGEGGMATVYRGYDTRLAVERAVKVLSPAMGRHPTIRQRFEAEARTMARLHHPNIVAVQDVGVDGERSFMVMEIMAGGSLMDRLDAHGVLDAVSACRATASVLSALAVAHAHGVVHRDIKPHNVLVGPDGVIKVSDFGIAHVADQGGPDTRTGTAMGTWAYMAPEQRSSAKHVDGRADLYALGATLYVLLTLEEPYDLYANELQDVLFARLHPAVREILQRACRFRPEDRYRDANEMLQAVNGALRALGATAAPLPALREPRTPADQVHAASKTPGATPANEAGVEAPDGVTLVVAAPDAPDATPAAPRPPAPTPAVASDAEPPSLPTHPTPAPTVPPPFPWLRRSLPYLAIATAAVVIGVLLVPGESTPRDRNRDTSAASVERGGPATRAARDPRTTGSLTVRVEGIPWGDVFIDGRRRGVTPKTLALPVGTYAVLVRDDATGMELRDTVTVAPEVTTLVMLRPDAPPTP
jgi:serine/threonine protein kinase